MTKLNIRFSLQQIENPVIYAEILQATEQGLKTGDTVKRLLLELVHKRELVNVLQGSVIPYELASNGQVSDENLLDVLD